MSGRELYSFTFEVVHSTNKAVLFTDGVEEFWIPKSQIVADENVIEDLEEEDRITIMLEEWLVEKKELI